MTNCNYHYYFISILIHTWSADISIGSLNTIQVTLSCNGGLVRDPIEISADQLHALRTLKCGGKCILTNRRPPVPLGDRTVRASFK